MSFYRVVAGKHHEGGKTYRAGDVFESKIDLVRLFNQPDSVKFELVNRHGQSVLNEQDRAVAPAPVIAHENNLGDGLEDMTVAELKAFAAEEEIDLGSATRKDEIIKEIRKAAVALAAEQGFES